MGNSTHRVEIVPVKLEKHENADSLSLVKVFDSYVVCVRTADWEGKDKGAYICPDSMVPDTEQFAFLKGHLRIKAKKLRGVWSMGMLVPAPEGSNIGDDVSQQLGIVKYNPPEHGPKLRSLAVPGPDHLAPVYDLDTVARYARATFEPGELVMVSEKVHGYNGRIVYDARDNVIHVGSHRRWVKDEPDNVWWKTVRQYPQLVSFCEHNPDNAVYFEIYGGQDLKYGLSGGELGLAIFDIYRSGKFIDALDAHQIGLENNLPWVPVLESAMEFDLEKVLKLAEGDTILGNGAHIREGVVVSGLKEKWFHHGRNKLKAVSLTYLEKS